MRLFPLVTILLIIAAFSVFQFSQHGWRSAALVGVLLTTIVIHENRRQEVLTMLATLFKLFPSIRNEVETTVETETSEEQQRKR